MSQIHGDTETDNPFAMSPGFFRCQTGALCQQMGHLALEGTASPGHAGIIAFCPSGGGDMLRGERRPVLILKTLTKLHIRDV